MKKAFFALCLAIAGCQGVFGQGKTSDISDKYWHEDIFFKSQYSNVEFSNVNGFLMLANSIRVYQNESLRKNSKSSESLEFSSPWDFSNLYSSTISTINTAKYTSYKIVDWLNSVENDLSELSAASYFYRYKSGHIEKDSRYTGVSAKGDSLMKVALPMLEEFAGVIRYDNNIAEMKPHITEYLTWVDKIINEQFSWLNNKTKKKYAYVTAKVSPFDFRSTVRTYQGTKKTQTLLQTGCGMVYDSWRCHANVKSEYPFFNSLVQTIIKGYLKGKEAKDEQFMEFLSASFFLMYCNETAGAELYQIEMENRFCSYNEKNTKCNGMTFIEFFEEFSKVYKSKGNKNKFDIICGKMADFRNQKK